MRLAPEMGLCQACRLLVRPVHLLALAFQGFTNFSVHQDYLESLLKTGCWTYPGVCDSCSLGRGLIRLTSNQVPDAAAAAASAGPLLGGCLCELPVPLVRPCRDSESVSCQQWPSVRMSRSPPSSGCPWKGERLIVTQ